MVQSGIQITIGKKNQNASSCEENVMIPNDDVQDCKQLRPYL